VEGGQSSAVCVVRGALRAIQSAKVSGKWKIIQRHGSKNPVNPVDPVLKEGFRVSGFGFQVSGVTSIRRYFDTVFSPEFRLPLCHPVNPVLN